MRKPLFALVLAILPFFLFFGSQSTVEVNGAVVSDTRFNILGIVLGAFAVGMALSVLRQSDAGRGVKVLGAVALLAGALQLAAASGMVRVDPMAWLFPDPTPETTQKAG